MNSGNRRDFLKSTASLVGGLMATGPFLAMAQTNSTEYYQGGYYSYGYYGYYGKY